MDNINKIAFLHGWGLNKQIWGDVVRLLKQRLPNIECQLLDLPGYGGAADIDNADDLDSLAEHCLGQLDSPVVLVAWSLGGVVAMRAAILALDLPQKNIQALQLITTAPKFVESSDWPYGVDLSVFQRFSNELASDYERTLTMFLLLQAGAAKGARELARSAHKAICELPSPSAKTLQDGIDCLAGADLRNDLCRLTLPVQVVSGMRDRVAKPESSAMLSEMLGAELVEFDTGHSPFMANPDEYIDSLLTFLHKVDVSV